MPAKKYDWPKLMGEGLEKGRLVLKRNHHYTCSQSSIVQQIRNAASHLNLKLTSLKDKGDRVELTVEKRTGREEPARKRA